MQKKCLILQITVGTLLCLAALACLPPPPIPHITNKDGSSYAPPVQASALEESQAEQLAMEIELLRGKAATSKENQLLEKYPTTAAAGDVFFSRAIKAHKAGRLPEALDYYARLLYFQPDSQKANQVRLEYGRLCLELGRTQEALETFRFLYANAELADEIDKLAVLYADSLSQNGHPDQALELLVERRNNDNLSQDRRNAAEQSAKQIVVDGLSFAQSQRLWDKYATNSKWEFLQPSLAFRLAKLYYHIRDFERSEKLLKQIVDQFPSSKWSEPASNFYSRLKNRFRLKPNTIGIMLPLSGRYKVYGERSLAAIRMVFAKSPELKLVVKDTQGDPTIAASHVESLVLDEHAIAIIGPLSSKASFSAALKAEELNIPMLALSHRDGLPQIGPYVFRTALTVEAQARALAKTAFETLGMTRFAILYPRSRYGSQFTSIFWDEVNRRQGEIRGIEAYEHDQTTFSKPVRKLVGRWYRNSRPDYHARKNKILERKLPPHRTAAALEKMQKNLPPLVDFDAIVIPDSGRNIGLIAPALAFEDIVMTKDPKTLQKIKKATGYEEIHPVTLLGASTWNSPRILRSCDRYCENAIFVDGYYADNPNPLVRDFVSSFKEVTGASPNLVDAQAFDTAGMLRWVLEGSKPATREALQENLLKASYFNGVTGKFRFAKNGEADKELFTLTISDKAIQLYKKPADTPQEG